MAEPAPATAERSATWRGRPYGGRPARLTGRSGPSVRQRSQSRPLTPARKAALILTVSTGVILYVFLFDWYAVTHTYDRWGGVFMAPFIFFATVPFLQRMLNRVEPDPKLRGIVIAGLAAKLIGSFARFFSNEYLIGHADASLYNDVGAALAHEFRNFVFSGPTVSIYLDRGPGTNFIRMATGVLYVLTGPTITGGYLLYSYLSYWGLYLFYRAHRIAMPDGLRRRYAVLLFFMPSMVFWPSSIGKEAWMTFSLGLGSYGLARLLDYRRYGYLAVGLGIAAMTLVRPHVAAIFAASLGAGFLLRRSKGHPGAGAKKLIGLLLLAVLAGILLAKVQSFFGVTEGLNAQEVFDETTRRSSQGGSEFTPVQPNSPVGLPWAIVTVLFRPFIFEASSAAALASAVEGTVFMAFFVWNVPRLARLPAQMFLRAYVGFSVAYTLIFVYAFSAIANFGILARQRTQLTPIALIVLTVPLQRSPRRLLDQRGAIKRANRRVSAAPHEEPRLLPGAVTSARAPGG